MIRNLIAAGTLRAKRLGRDFFISPDDVTRVPAVRKPGPKAKGSAK